MRAHSLQVNLVGPCNAKCPFCISKTTWKTGISDNERIQIRLSDVMKYAKYHHVDSVMITGTGEPTLLREIEHVAIAAKNEGLQPIEIQTNGTKITTEEELAKLRKIWIDCISISVASIDPEKNKEIMGIDHNYLTTIEKAANFGFLTRISLNLVSDGLDIFKLIEWADKLADHGVRQLTLRQIGHPSYNQLDTETADRVSQWIDQNAMTKSEVKRLIDGIDRNGVFHRKTSFGANIYDFRGLSTCVTSCLTENTDPDEITSFILQPDGRVYTSWQLPGSVIF